jgi:hypothetical protein
MYTVNTEISIKETIGIDSIDLMMMMFVRDCRNIRKNRTTLHGQVMLQIFSIQIFLSLSSQGNFVVIDE